MRVYIAMGSSHGSVCTIMQREQTWHVEKRIGPGTYISDFVFGLGAAVFQPHGREQPLFPAFPRHDHLRSSF